MTCAQKKKLTPLEVIASAFFRASASGDVGQLRSLLAENVVAYADGGGEAKTHPNPVYGRDRDVRMLVGLASKPWGQPARWIRSVRIDGLPGSIAYEHLRKLQTMALVIEDGSIIACFSCGDRRNRRLETAVRLHPSNRSFRC